VCSLFMVVICSSSVVGERNVLTGTLHYYRPFGHSQWSTEVSSMADKLIVGCGYLGRRVAARWLAQGHRVFGTTRSQEKADELGGLGVDPVICDVLEPERLNLLPAASAVLYCVGLDSTSGASMSAVYVEGLEAFRLRYPVPAERFIYVSSTSVYAQSQGEDVNEACPTEPQEPPGTTLLAAEERARSIRECVILRFAGIYGPGRLIRRKTVEAGEAIIGDPDKWLNLIHVEDGARAILAAEASTHPHRVYNICDDHPVRRRDFYTEMAYLLGAPEPRFVAPTPGAP